MEKITLQDRSTEALLAEYARTRSLDVRAAVVERHEALVRSLARKFERPGVPLEDIIQSAWIALIGAVDRFDPVHGAKFSTYAVHCIVGEIKRYFRDNTWSFKAPRHLQDIAANLARTEDDLQRKLQRKPSIAEMAEALKVSQEDLLQAMELHSMYQPYRWEERQELDDGNSTSTLGETVGSPDPKLEAVVDHVPLERAIARLDERRQRIVRRRFFEGCTQQEIAQELGLSQMHVSRLERSALRELRTSLCAA
jgi:RNA polymerase sigma-B factor